MRQLLQRLDSGELYLEDVPVPRPHATSVVSRSRASLVSAGTERMLVEFGKSGWIRKARSQPDRVKQVLQKLQTDGVAATIEAVQAKLAAPRTLGYCSAGVVHEVGDDVDEFAPGDRVVTNGPHGEYVRVPRTLTAAIPDGVSFSNAAFTPVAAIGLQGVRLADPDIGETVVVYGLGLIGLLTVQILRAAGCRVIGIDLVERRLELAREFGAVAMEGGSTDLARRVRSETSGRGADAVLLTLSSGSDEPMHNAARMSREKGRLVQVGVTGMDLVRDDFYEKELSLTVSSSYGPGRYDPQYEKQGQDYPLPYVRWTAQRNFEAALDLMASGALDPSPLVTHTFPFDDVLRAYDVVTGEDPSIGIVLEYSDADDREAGATIVVRGSRATEPLQRAPTVGLVGAGAFARRTLLPILRDLDVRMKTVVTSGGTSGSIAAKEFGIEESTTDPDRLWSDGEIDAVFVLTRHDSHARYAVRALEAGRHVFVEKPLAISDQGLDAVEDGLRASDALLTVGFNRRHAPLARELRERLRGRGGPLSVTITVNAGRLPEDHWTKDPRVGGGRIVGEGCHFIDLARYFVGAPIDSLHAVAGRQGRRVVTDVSHIQMRFRDGSIASLHYLASGHPSVPKERIECFVDGGVLSIQNWRDLDVAGEWGGLSVLPSRQDKGHRSEIEAWLKAIRETGEPPIPTAELLEVSRWSLEADRLARADGYGSA